MQNNLCVIANNYQFIKDSRFSTRHSICMLVCLIPEWHLDVYQLILFTRSVFSDGIPGWGGHGRWFPASDGQSDPSLTLHGGWLWTAEQAHHNDFQKILLNTTLLFLSHQPHSPLTPPSLFFPKTLTYTHKKGWIGVLKLCEAKVHKSQ